MQPSNTGGYSDFFKSGFRAFTTRSSCGQTSSSLHDFTTYPTFNTASLTPSKPTFYAIKRRPRPVSVIVQNTPREKARRRRSSFIAFTSHLFDRKSTTASDEKSTKSSINSSCSNRSSYVFDSGDSPLPDVWITAGGPFTVSGSSDQIVLNRPTDSFDTKSTYFDLSQDDDFGSDTRQRDSFLSFTSSSNRSSIMITHRSSIPSRRSSFHYHLPLGQEKSDLFWVVERENDLLLSSDVMEVDHEDDAPANTDWRQFHVDILTNDM